MKSFDDFLYQLPADDYQLVLDETLGNLKGKALTDQIPELAYQISLQMLRRYHEWANKDDQDRD